MCPYQTRSQFRYWLKAVVTREFSELRLLVLRLSGLGKQRSGGKVRGGDKKSELRGGKFAGLENSRSHQASYQRVASEYQRQLPCRRAYSASRWCRWSFRKLAIACAMASRHCPSSPGAQG